MHGSIISDPLGAISWGQKGPQSIDEETAENWASRVLSSGRKSSLDTSPCLHTCACPISHKDTEIKNAGINEQILENCGEIQFIELSHRQVR